MEAFDTPEAEPTLKLKVADDVLRAVHKAKQVLLDAGAVAGEQNESNNS